MSKKATKAKPAVSSHNYQSNDIVLAKLRGYPPWPGVVVDEEDIPPTVSKERPANKKGSGSIFCVRFFPVGDHSWLTSKEISLLQKHEIEAYINEPHKKNGDLLNGYKIALDPAEWLQKMKEAAANPQVYDPENEVDELEEEEDGEGGEDSGKKAKGTKRKRDPEVKSKPRKSVGGGEKAKRTKKSAKSAEAVESEDESKPSAPKKTKKEVENDSPEIKQVRDWRHALQRIFLGKLRAKDEDMPAHDKLFSEVENHKDMTLNQLTETKIGKVMRHIAAAEDGKIPRDEEFKFRERAGELVEKWQRIAQSVQPNGEPQINGDAEEPNVTDQSAVLGDVTMTSDEPNGVNDTAPAAEAEGPVGETLTNGQAIESDMAVDAT